MINNAKKYQVPVLESTFDRVMQLMEQSKVEWQGNLNHIDAFLLASENDRGLINKLTPYKSNKARNIVYVDYFG
ncbi:hypothetical protein [Anabaena lutea]|uniref:Uncharacterized protein n=1 Tax=Anabaena lutea FACHB-196 TaxID=2692881 RepID=A0ABR8F898_9NOST|nr:hypothetical protein [Anabaena lutea]MBD2566420.1 hypothetical protein [Anabaena lutea FACHB-196]